MASDDDILEIGGEGSNLRYRRHINPDGTQGGWVSIDAHVAKTVYVGRDAKVNGIARVKGRARILDQANVSGNVEGDSVVCDQARVGEGCTVRGSSMLSGQTNIQGRGSIIEGYTMLKDIGIGGENMVLLGGEFMGIPSPSGASHLYCRLDEAGRVSRLFLWCGKEEELKHADQLLEYVTISDTVLRAKDTKVR